jgi:hypothetical protein
MSTAIKTKFNVDKIETAENLKLGDKTVTSLIDSGAVTAIGTSSSVSLSIGQNAGAPSAKIYDSAELLPGNADSGSMALVTATNRLYLYNGTGWYNIAIVNTTPVFQTSPDSNYTLDGAAGTAITITILATDSDGNAITYSTTSDSASNFVTISQDSGVFTLTPLTKDQADSNGVNTSAASTFTITFKATDGVNVVPAISTFSITFINNYNWLDGSEQAGPLQHSGAASNDYNGSDVSLNYDGDTAIIGAQGDNSGRGQAYIFDRSGTTWSETATLEASDRDTLTNPTNNNFGYSTAISADGTTAVVGSPYAYYHNGSSSNSYGKGYAYKKIDGTWTEISKSLYDRLVTVTSGTYTMANDDWIGSDVDIDKTGTRMIVGAQMSSNAGGAFIFNNPGLAKYVIPESGATYDQLTNQVSSTNAIWNNTGVVEHNPSFVLFTADMTKLILLGYDGDKLYQFSTNTSDTSSLGILYDDVSVDVSDVAGTGSCMRFGDSGTKMFFMNQNSRYIYTKTLSTAYDISTLSSSYTSWYSGETTSCWGFDFKSDGTKFYVVNQSNDHVYQYSLSTPWDLSTESYDGDSERKNVSSQSPQPSGVTFSADGTKMFIADDTYNSEKVYQYTLSTAWDVSTASYDNKYVTLSSRYNFGVSFNADGSYMYLCSRDSNRIYRYKTNGYIIESEAFLQDENYTSKGSAEAGISVAISSKTGNYAIVGAHQYNNGSATRGGAAFVYKRTGTTWSQDTTLLPSDAATDDRFGYSVDINEDGSYAVVGAWQEDDTATNAGSVYVFNSVTSGFNIGSASYTQASPAFTSQETYFTGFLFNGDGTKLYILGTTNYTWKRYSLSTAYDITTASYDGSSYDRSNTAAMQHPCEVRWGDSGSKVYIMDFSDNYIYQMNLSTAYDMTTASHYTFLSSNMPTGSEGFDLSPDGTKMITCTSGRAREYTLSTAWNISTASYVSSWYSSDGYYLNQNNSTSPVLTASSICWNGDGTKFFVADDYHDKIFQYSVSHAYEVRGVTYDGVELDLSSYSAKPLMISFENAGSGTAGGKLFVSDPDADKLFEYSATGPVWSQQAKFQAQSPAASMYFGEHVSIDDRGKTIAVGERYYNSQQGRAYIYRRIGSSWYYTNTLYASNAGTDDAFGRDLALSGDGGYLIVGARNEDTTAGNAGAAYIYKAPVPASGTTITTYTDTETTIQHSDVGSNDDYFGRAIALDTDGNTAIISAPMEDTDTTNAGRCYIFAKSDAGTWSEQYDFGSGITQANSYFGWSGVSISGDGNVALAGKPSQDSGRVAIHTRSGTSWSSYGALTGEVNDGRFGASCAISGDGTTIAIGAERQSGSSSSSLGNGAAYIYVKNNSNVWTLQQKINPNSTGSQGSGDQYFGASITLSNDGNTVAIGAPGQNSTGSVTGRVEVWTRSGTTWTHQQTVVPSSRGSRDTFGWRCALSGTDGNTLVVGQLYEFSSYAGYAWIFTRSGTTWTQETTLRGSDSANGDHFGCAVAISNDGTKVLVGAENDTISSGQSSGSAYIFEKTGYDLSGATHSTHQSLTYGGNTNITDIAFNSDGTKMYAVGYGNDSIEQYSLSTAYDPTSLTYDNVQFSLSSQTPNYPIGGMHFKPDGTKLFVCHRTSAGGGSHSVFAYDLSTGFDLSTASYNDEKLADTDTTNATTGITFNNDGTKLYLSCDRSGNPIKTFTLSTAWDLSSYTYGGTGTDFSVTNEDTNNRGIAFNSDGTKFFMVGETNDAVYSYSLTSAFDLSTASYDNVVLGISSQEGNPCGITFNADGTKMFISGTDGDGVDIYTTAWSQKLKYEPDSPDNNDQYGYAVGLSKDASTVMIGAPFEDTGASAAGSVYIYDILIESY